MISLMSNLRSLYDRNITIISKKSDRRFRRSIKKQVILFHVVNCFLSLFCLRVNVDCVTLNLNNVEFDNVFRLSNSFTRFIAFCNFDKFL